MRTFDITPETNVLIALGRTQMSPLDALSELIDNAIDSINQAKLEGDPVEHPLILVELPGPTEAERGEGIIRVRDNGAGMDAGDRISHRYWTHVRR